ncbi:MAG: hypothetical protein QNK43_14265 [Amphritea sp.]|nr:hypothetical protein [Amphritea sp.]
MYSTLYGKSEESGGLSRILLVMKTPAESGQNAVEVTDAAVDIASVSVIETQKGLLNINKETLTRNTALWRSKSAAALMAFSARKGDLAG